MFPDIAANYQGNHTNQLQSDQNYWGFPDECQMEPRKKVTLKWPLSDDSGRSSPSGRRSTDDGSPVRLQKNDQESKKAAGHVETCEARQLRKSQGVYDVCEVFSPARLTAQCAKFGLRGGWALDVAHNCTVTGRKWDCLIAEDRDWCKRMVYRDKPQLLVVSPPCTLFSQLQNLSPHGLPEVRCPDAYAEARLM